MRVLVLKADRLQSELFRTALQLTRPNATVTAVQSVRDAALHLLKGYVDLVVTDVVAADGDVIDLILEWSGSPRVGGVFVVTAHKEPAILNALSTAPIRGILDQTNEGADILCRVSRHVADGGAYWSTTIQDAIARGCRSPDSLFRQLTFTEQLVLSVIGDGREDKSAAELLGMTENTVMTIRRNLHRKLGIQHKGELVRVATANGFVLITPYGIVRPGFAGMLATRSARFRKHHPASPAVVAPAAHPDWEMPLEQVA